MGTIIKYLKRGGAVMAGLLLLLAPAVTHAAGESYAWTSSADTAITASGGGYPAAVTLNKAGQDATTVSFTGTATLSCNSVPIQVAIEADVAVSDYKQADPTPVVINASPGCPDANLDALSSITSSSAAATAAGATATQAAQCNQGAFSWLVCPLMDKISQAVGSIATEALTPLLQVKPLSQATTPGLYQAWDNVKNLAELIFVIVFIVAIISTAVSFGLDRYTIKRMMPRLVAAAILIQFSFFICAFIVDAGNVLGGGIQSLILANLPASTTMPNQDILANLTGITGALALGGVAIWASFALAGPVLLMLLLSTLAFLFTLAARYIILAVLVALAPLAIVAWILPNTAGYAKKWATLFIRLILMYPIILGLLAIGERVNEIFGFTNQTTTNAVTGTLTDILKPLIIVAIFAAIPRTFKWAGGVMATTHNTFSGLAGTGNKKIRGSDWHKDRNNQRRQRQHDAMDTLMNSSAITSLSGSKNPIKRGAANGFVTAAGWTMGTTASNALAHQRTLAQGQTGYAKELDDLGASPMGLHDVLKSHYSTNAAERATARRNLSVNYPELQKYSSNAAGRMAAVQQLESMGALSTNVMMDIARTAPNEYGSALRAARRSFSKIPTTLSRFSEGEIDAAGVAHHAGEFKPAGLKAVVEGLGAAGLANDFSVQNFVDAAADPQIAQTIAESASDKLFGGLFRAGTASYGNIAKRNNVIKMMTDQPAAFRSGKGKIVKEAVLGAIEHSDETFARQLVADPQRLGGPGAPGTAATLGQVMSYIRLRLN